MDDFQPYELINSKDSGGQSNGEIRGVYHHVSPQYAERYFNEFAFPYSHRKDETPMFHLFLGRLLRTAHLQDGKLDSETSKIVHELILPVRQTY